MRAPLVLLVAAWPLACAAGCIVSFDEVPRGCDAGECVDVQVPPEDVAAKDRAAGDVFDAHKVDVEAGHEAGSCKGVGDGGLCGAGDPCHEPPICKDGVCTPQPKADGTPCGLPTDDCHSIPACKAGVCGASTALADGTQWKSGDDNARCCGGMEVETTSTTNCGVCKVACKTGQSCTAVDGHYFCTPCKVDGDCWSNCCSFTSSPDGHCSPSDCNTGVCQVPNICPDGAHCQRDVVNYCSY